MKYLIAFLFCLSVNATPLYKKCISCHGKQGEGKKSMKAPKIAGQHSWYLENQLKLIRDKKRTSGYSKRMYPFVKKLSDKDIKALSDYLEGLK